jgi:exopolysaccharide production protein ExoQ
LALGAALLAPLSLIVPLAITPLSILLALLAAFDLFRGFDRAARHAAWPRGATAIAGLALLWMAASIGWAVVPGGAARAWGAILLSTLGGLALAARARLLTDAERARIGRALVAGSAVALVLLTLEALARLLGLATTPQHLVLDALGMRFNASRLNRGLTVTALAVWLAAGVIAQRRGWRGAWILPAWMLLLVPAFESFAATLAMVAGVAAALLVALHRRAARALMLAGIALGFAAMPLLPHWAPFQTHFADRARDGSVWHRAEIWSFVSGRIAERPLLGWGLDSARDMPGGKDLITPGAEKLPLHPHNGMLQLWLELGALGAACGAALALLAAWRVTDPARAAAARIAEAGALAAALAIFATAYGVWQAWWIATLWIAAALARARDEASPR